MSSSSETETLASIRLFPASFQSSFVVTDLQEAPVRTAQGAVSDADGPFPHKARLTSGRKQRLTPQGQETRQRQENMIFPNHTVCVYCFKRAPVSQNPTGSCNLQCKFREFLLEMKEGMGDSVLEFGNHPPAQHTHPHTRCEGEKGLSEPGATERPWVASKKP